MVVKKIRSRAIGRKINLYLPRVYIEKYDPTINKLKENRNIRHAPRRSSFQFPSPIQCIKKEQCIFHTEIDLNDENIIEHGAHCSCSDSTLLFENKEKARQELIDQILANANFDNLPPLRNLHEEAGTQTIDLKTLKYSCKVCYSQFNSLEFYKHHLTFHQSKLFGCSFCNATFTNKTKLRGHLLHHLNKNFYECYNCRASFEHKYELRKHMRTHQEKKWWACNICSAKFDKNIDLENHKMRHVSGSSGSLVHIFRKVKDANAENGTIEIHVPNEPQEQRRGYSCRKCKNLTFPNYAVLQNHEKIHSRREGDHVCDICQGRFLRNWTLLAHQKRAH